MPPAGSNPARRSCASIPTRRCSSVASEPCSSSRCIRSPWRASLSTPTTATIPGVGCSARRTTWRRPRSGRRAEAQRAVDVVRRVHEHVVGVAPDGRPYAANDPHLLRWVHLAELDSFLTAHDRYGAEPLRGADRDRYVAEVGVVARALGVSAPPETERGLRDQLRSFRSGAARHDRSPRGRSLPAAAAAAAARGSPGVRPHRRRGGGA